MRNLCYILFFLVILGIKPALAEKPSCPGQSSAPAQAQEQYLAKSLFRINAIDPTPQSNPIGAYYPGVRGGNQLIIYTPAYSQRTGTNEFGKEVVVVNNIVTDITGSNSFIPQNGFVISGHGRAKKWIDENIIIGAKITISPDLKNIESTILPQSYTFQAEQKIEQVQKIISEYQSSNKHYEAKKSQQYLKKAQGELTDAKRFLANNDLDMVKEKANSASMLADKALYYAIPAKPGEFHGLWLRPTEKNPEQIALALDKIRDARIDNVFLETYYQGSTIFPSKTLEANGVINQKKEFQGWDPLKVWIDEAHKRNMKIHVWFQTFYAGNEDPVKNPTVVTAVHPAWINVQKRNYAANKPMPSPSEHQGYFLDPANPEVQQYLTCLITEIVTNYDIDGLNIDYIRYPASLSRTFPNYLESTWGYTTYARNEFMSQYNVDPVTLSLDDPLWEKWTEYRKSKVTEIVSKLKPILCQKKILLSTVIFPDLEESSVAKLQDWGTWAKNSYIDAFTPLVMGSDELLAEYYVKQIRERSQENILIYPGLFEPFNSGSPSDLLKQVKAVRASNVSGVVIFDYAHLNQAFIEALKARAFAKEN